MEAHFRAKYPKSPEDSDGVYRSVIRAKALDTLRGLLPAATTSNVGLFGTGQAFEALLLRMFAHPLEEVRALRAADARRAAPGDPGVPRARRSAGPRRPLDRVSSPTPGARSTSRRGRSSDGVDRREPRGEVTLTDFDPDGEIKVVAAALYAVSDAARRSAAGDRARSCPPTIARRCCAPTSATAPTAATSRAARSSAPATASTSSPTTAPSAICSATGC